MIWLHISGQDFSSSFPSNEWMVRNVYDSMVRWSVPVFVMISGALFLDTRKPLNIIKLYTKNILRIIIAFLFWSVLYELYMVKSNIGLKSFIVDVCAGHFHLWFSKMLLGLYVMIPIFKAIVADKKAEQYFLCIAFITTFIIPYILFPAIAHFSKELGLFCENFFDSLGIKIASGYSGYFVLGHYLNTYDLGIKKMFCFLQVVLEFYL